MKPSRKATGWTALAVVFVGGFEGLRTVAYRDPVGIPTVCFGETRGVKMGDLYTREECDAMLADRLVEFDKGVGSCVKTALPDTTRTAFVSISYNIGTRAFCGSSIVRLWNAGYSREACDAMLKWNTAKGIPLPGLTRRRKEERALCLEGL